ncbi:MAG: NAD kinase [Flavobacteriales bacterium]
MKIALYGKRFNEEHAGTVATLVSSLVRKGVAISVHDTFYQFLQSQIGLPSSITTFDNFDNLKGTDILISVGGDGTLLDTAAIVRDSKTPVLGLNTGRLGFLANVSPENIEEAMEALINGDYSLDPRTLIEVRSEGQQFGDFPFALNEVAILNHERNSMVTIHAYVNDQFMSTYWADGLIIATPTGSTAYSLSCGGPIVAPGSSNFILTPIAPHNLNVRPLILNNSSKISLRAEGRAPEFLMSIDSRPHLITADTTIELTCATFLFNLVELHGQSFFNTIRHKLGWGMDKRN